MKKMKFFILKFFMKKMKNFKSFFSYFFHDLFQIKTFDLYLIR